MSREITNCGVTMESIDRTLRLWPHDTSPTSWHSWQSSKPKVKRTKRRANEKRSKKAMKNHKLSIAAQPQEDSSGAYVSSSFPSLRWEFTQVNWACASGMKMFSNMGKRELRRGFDPSRIFFYQERARNHNNTDNTFGILQECYMSFWLSFFYW